VVESLRINCTKSKQVVCCKVLKSYTEARPTSDPPRPHDLWGKFFGVCAYRACQ